MEHVVVRTIDRADADVIDALGALGVANVHEAQGQTGLMKPYMRPVISGSCIAGSAVTVLCHPGDNLMMHVAIEVCRPGDVIVVGLSSDCDDPAIGDLIATSLMAHGVRGAVVDAGCRDVPVLREMGFPVWSKAIYAKGITKDRLGAVNVPIVCAGVQITPGDVIIADDDGVVAVPVTRAPDVCAAGRAREADEETMRARLVAGELRLDFADMRADLAARGLKYRE